MPSLLNLAWIVTVLLALTAPADAKRVALLIGNDAYENVQPLKKAVNDAEAMAVVLGKLQFDTIVAKNAGRREMNQKLLEFTSQLGPGDEAVFFFAGHGVEIDGRNFLLPVDVPNALPGQDRFVMGESIPEDHVLEQIRARGARINILILDACRNNPFKSVNTRSVGGTRGLARPIAPEGTFILYSAGVGQTALDTLGEVDSHPNSVFTRSLIPLLQTPGLSLPETARAVRMRVKDLARTIGHDQRPAYYDEVTGRFQFTPGETKLAVGITPGTGLNLPSQQKACKGITISLATGEKICRKTRGDASFRDCPDCPAMVVLPPGQLRMGSYENEAGRKPSEGPLREVTFRRAFAVGKYEVTRGEFAAFVKATGHDTGTSCFLFKDSDWKHVEWTGWRDPGFEQGDDHPVTCVNWEDAEAYAAWLVKKTGKPYRLLSEAEWEYAARAETSPGRYPPFHFGADANDICAYANIVDRSTGARWAFQGCSDGVGFGTAQSGRYRPNAFGLHDLYGNVTEYVADCSHDDYSGAPVDGSAWLKENCGGRVARGGAWGDLPEGARSATRHTMRSPALRSQSFGFRVARTLDQK